MKSSIAVVVLAAGAGKRMKSAVPKVLHPLAGWPMLRHVLENAARLRPAKIVGVIAPGAKAVAQAFAPHPSVVQTGRRHGPRREGRPGREGPSPGRVGVIRRRPR
jgi:bifunctional UDP-N-acetylglucosamine pyrophosphorylase/glucosamine-1-phosphate N-acetyltransferase